MKSKVLIFISILTSFTLGLNSINVNAQSSGIGQSPFISSGGVGTVDCFCHGDSSETDFDYYNCNDGTCQKAVGKSSGRAFTCET